MNAKLTRKETAVQAVLEAHAKVEPGHWFGSVASLSEAAGGTATFTTVDAVRVARDERSASIVVLAGPRAGGYYRGPIAEVLRLHPEGERLVIHNGIRRLNDGQDDNRPAVDDTPAPPVDENGDRFTLPFGDIATVTYDGMSRLTVVLHAPVDVLVTQAA